MFGNLTGRRFQVTDLAVANILAATTLTVSVPIVGGGLVAGDMVLITPRAMLTNGIGVYGHVIDATHIGINFVNGSAGAIDPADTFDFDVLVIKATGSLNT